MFTSSPAAFPYADPWTQDFSTRLAQLARGRRRVAYFYELPDTSTFRYRIWNMIEALRESGEDIGAAWFCIGDFEHLGTVLDACDTVVICRMRYSAGVARLVAGARARGRRLLFDVDDLVFDDRYVHLVLETLDQNTSDEDLNFWFGWIGRIGATMRLCDGVILTNQYLAERAAAFSGLPTWVVPNFLNAAQMDVSAGVLEGKRRTGFARDGRIHLGYFSGTPTHNRDFGIIADTLARLLRRDSRLVLRLVGFLEPRGALAALPDRVERFPLQDFLNLQRLVGGVELNLVPLQDNTFTNCKSELKVFEASVVGTVSIASPGFTLRRTITHGETGWLAPSHEWETTLERAIGALDDAYPGMAEAAAAVAEARYRPAAQVAAITEAVFGV